MKLVLGDLVQQILKNTLHHVRLLLIHDGITLNQVSLNLLENVGEEVLHDSEELLTLIVLIRDLLEPFECSGQLEPELADILSCEDEFRFGHARLDVLNQVYYVVYEALGVRHSGAQLVSEAQCLASASEAHRVSFDWTVVLIKLTLYGTSTRRSPI